MRARRTPDGPTGGQYDARLGGGARTALVACLRMADMVVTVGRKRRVT